MATVSARRLLVGASVGEAEALWYALERRTAFVDGLAHVDRVEGDWPSAGSRIAWVSPPGGRGRVLERVSGFEPGASQTADVEDAEVGGSQTVRFAADGGGCQMTIEFAYRLKREDLGASLADTLFIRRKLRTSLERTLARFAIELAAERELHS